MPSPATLARLAVQAGASFVLYAGALVLATVLQSTHDAAITAERYPLMVAVDRIRSERELTAAQVQRAVQSLADATGKYRHLDAATVALAEALDRLAVDVKRATGSAAQLPASLPMPAAPPAVTFVAPAPAPVTNSTTGASGR